VVADIANASAEQAGGIEQVNKALNQMDEVTQQNSALVEENAATAKTLEAQAQAMNERVSVFQLGNVASPSMTPAADADKAAMATARTSLVKPQLAKQAAKLAARSPSPARRMQASLATAFQHHDDWKEF
jgi:methyl-accepting chemotaxis protein